LTALAALGIFEGALQQAVHGLKYEQLTSLAAPLGTWLADHVTRLGWPPSLIAPVPLHADRLAARGYNQAALLGQALAATLDWPWQPDLLTRQRATPSQVGLNYQERQANVKDAFVLNQPLPDPHPAILLVDDVFTTGATIRACADVLQAAGTGPVRAVVVGRARSPGQS
jgi:ComF family protein